MLWITPNDVECLPTYRSCAAKKSNSPGKTSHLSVSIMNEACIYLIFMGEHSVRPCALTIVGFIVGSAFNYILSCDEAKKKHSGLC
jgi:hypothetical protein